MKLDPKNPPTGISRVQRNGRILFSVQWREEGQTRGTTVSVSDGDELDALRRAIAIRAEHVPAAADETRDRTMTLKFTQTEHRRMMRAKGARAWEPWARETLLDAAP